MTDRVVTIAEPEDVSVCRRRVSSYASKMGFPDVAVGEVAILVTELVENVVRHGGGRGELRFGELTQEGRRGLEIICSDGGPGLDRARAFSDGFSSGNSLGIGLGAVARFADSCEARTPEGGQGSEIVVIKWLPADSTGPPQAAPWHAARVEVGARSRPYPGASVNGDAYAVRFLDPARVIAAVIDGLGHGVEAHLAASEARAHIELHAGAELSELFEGLGRRLRNTRGVVAAVADIDLDARTLRFAGIGNIEASVIAGDGVLQLVSTGGIIGHNVRHLRPFEYAWRPGQTLMMCSDGVHSGWRTAIDSAILLAHPDVVAATIISQHSRSTDDATALGVREKD
jgi:anti-sigma regulatory factor (Ser/Thr protein kinase)